MRTHQHRLSMRRPILCSRMARKLFSLWVSSRHWNHGRTHDGCTIHKAGGPLLRESTFLLSINTRKRISQDRSSKIVDLGARFKPIAQQNQVTAQRFRKCVLATFFLSANYVSWDFYLNTEHLIIKLALRKKIVLVKTNEVNELCS